MTTTPQPSNPTVVNAQPGEAQIIVDAALASAKPTEIKPGKLYTIVAPAGHQPTIVDLDLDKYRDTPRRKTGDYTVHDADSFATYLTKHGDNDTEMWADLATSTVLAVINAHGTLTPGWGDHNLRLQLRHTVAWKAWTKNHARMLDQPDFAEHIEERAVDILHPVSADMLELAQSFQATRSVAFQSGRRLKDGQVQLTYREETDATAGRAGQLAIPDRFVLALKPYEGADPYQVTARLRWRINGQHLTIGYVLDRPDEVLQNAYNDVVTKVADLTGRTILHGVTS